MALGWQAEPVGFAFHYHAQRAPWALEGFGFDVDGFADITTRLNLVVHGHQYAFATRILVAGHSDSVVQVEHTVSGHCGAWTHRADDNDRLVGLLDQVEEVGGLFQGVGTVGDDDAVDVLAVGQLSHALAQLQQVVVADAFGGDLHHLFAAHIGKVCQFRNTSDQLVYAQLGGLVGRAVRRAGASAGDGAASGEDHHIGQFLLVFDFFGVDAGGQ
ncbi:hypothetical protein D3C81_932170 [compost metagenome]